MGGSDALCPVYGKGHCAPVIVFFKKWFSNGLEGGDFIVFMMVCVSVCVRETGREQNRKGVCSLARSPKLLQDV